MFQDFDWLQAMRTSPVMLIIVGCSIVTVAFTLERFIYFWRRRENVGAVAQAARERIHDGDLQGATRECARSRHPLGPVASEVLRNVHRSTAEVEETLQIAIAEQRLLLERNVGVLGTMGNTAPLLGLLGTVWGIMRAFHDMASTGSAGPSVVAAGVAEALFTTAAGLLVAVPAVLLFNHFTRRITVTLTVAETQARHLRLAAVAATSGEKPPQTHAASQDSGRSVAAGRGQAKSAGRPTAGLEVAVRP